TPKDLSHDALSVCVVSLPNHVSPLDLVDLAPTVVHEIVIPLHYALEFLHVFAVLAAALHHTLELGHVRHLHLGHEHPVPVGADVGHDPHLRHTNFGAQLRHCEELLDQGPYLPRLAVHDLANEEHAGSPVFGLGTRSGRAA